ncbi:U4 U6.U5 tri-snRNP-associated protein, partial [Coemansia sp. RSA 2618]
YVLPENYEVADRSLNDIKDVIRPLYTTGDIARLDAETRTLHDLAGSSYVPGFVGLNRIKSNSYMNVILQLVAHISPIRDSLLLAPNNDRASALVRKLSALVRQMWHTRRFKAHVSPHECVQEVVALSKRRFGLDVECDPFELLVWMLNAVHIGLGGGSKPKSKRGSIVYKTFRGEMCVTTQALGDTQVRTSEDAPLQIDMEKSTEVATSPFLALSLELPPKPLFTSTVSAGNNDEDDEDGRADIPQVALTTLLERYDGSMAVEVNGLARQYQVTQLPPFVICHVKRFSTRGFLAEKNPTVVNYAVRNVPFGQLLPEHAHAERAATYDLVVNVCHVGNHVPKSSAQSSGNSGAPDVPTEDVGSAAESPFVAFVRHASNKWFKLHDLQVEPIMPQMMFLADSYIQVWQ